MGVNAQRLVEGEDLLATEVGIEMDGWGLLQKLVLVVALVLDHGDASRWMLAEGAVLKQAPEEVVLVLRRLGQIDRPGDDRPVLEDVVRVLLAVRFEHEAGHTTRGGTWVLAGVLGTRRARGVLCLADEDRLPRARRRDADRSDQPRAERREGQRNDDSPPVGGRVRL